MPEVLHPLSPATGAGFEASFTIQPVTPTLSVPVMVTEKVSDPLVDAGSVKTGTPGATSSEAGIAAFEAADATLIPTPLVAVTVHV